MSTTTDWIMIGITGVYVVATIFICMANIKAAEVTSRQLFEMQRQFEAANRPYVSCQYILGNRLFCGIRFYNYGNKPAYETTFKINQEFLDIIEFKERFPKLNDAVYLFGVGQHYDFYFSSINHFKKAGRKPFHVNIRYSCDGIQYSDTVTIEFDKQLPLESIDTYEDNLLKLKKEQIEMLEAIANSIKQKGSDDV